MSVFGQDISKKEALQYARKLGEVEILSAKGVELLTDYIENNRFERMQRPNPDGGIPVRTELLKSQILLFLSNAFGSELHYRSSATEYQNSMAKYLENYGIKDLMSPEEHERITDSIQTLSNDFEGALLEENIVDEEDSITENRSLYLDPFSFPSMEEYGLIHTKRSAMGKTLSRTLNDLNDLGLIDQKVLDQVMRKINLGEIWVEALAIQEAACQVIYTEDFDLNKKNELKFIRGLNRAGVLSDSKMEEHIASYQPQELKSKFQILEYCNNAKVFEAANYPTDPVEGYKRLFKDLKELIPGFNYSSLEIRLIDSDENWGAEMQERKLHIAFNVNNNNYQNATFYDFVKLNEEADPDTLFVISQDFHQGINKFLTDQNSEYRLYFANNPEGGDYYGKSKFGLILLTEEQYEAWGTYNADYFLFTQNHDNTFNSGHIKETIDQYRNLGLFDHLTDEEIEEGHNCVSNNLISSYAQLLSCFPKTVVYFDWETGNLENPYEELTISFSEASRGKFTPTNIVDTFAEDWQSEHSSFSFEFNNSKYASTLNMASDWLDPEFLSLIKKALADNQIDSNIYYCLDDGQASGYILLTQNQYETLSESQPELFEEIED
ncbi:hypothetical protein OZ410_06455 [Robiginitalea sp. M366]|uniref:hypothetical protein n=1 Tax=Robiginitalea aestuariiviva TaxID=3036903 RepID=UPI00240D7032|nr:hypothetical protein [Robiginitalea aestuariiviva]MDG1571951.1 hypothetical protein [Robiginitalea aestuariiviva]